jgi:hypothetical protein
MERNVVILLPYLLPSGRNKKRGILADGQPVIKSREVALLMNSAPKARAMLGIRALQGALRMSSQRLLITSTKRMHTPALCGTWEIDIFFPSRYDWTTGVNCRRPVPEAWIRQGDLIQGGWGGLAEISLICSRGQDRACFGQSRLACDWRRNICHAAVPAPPLSIHDKYHRWRFQPRTFNLVTSVWSSAHFAMSLENHH